MKTTAGEMFYAMKQVEMQVSELEEEVVGTKRKDLMEKILAKRQKLRELETQYDRFLSELDIYEGLSEQDRLVFRMARLFGECEVAMPRDFRPRSRNTSVVGNLLNGFRTASSAPRKMGSFPRLPMKCGQKIYRRNFFIWRFKRVGSIPRPSGLSLEWDMPKGFGNLFRKPLNCTA